MTNLSEFAEMIARVAELKYKADGNLTLAEKICEILKVILGIINANAIVP